MSGFRNRCLGVLDNVYGFLSARKSADSVQLQQPIQLVHDVSREAEVGSAFGLHRGLAIVELTVTHGGATTELARLDIHNEILNSSSGPDPIDLQIQAFRDFDVWLIDYTAANSAAVVTTAYVALNYPAINPEAAVTYTVYPLALLDSDAHGWSNYTATGLQRVLVMANQLVYPRIPRPIYIPPGTYFTSRSTTTGAASIEYRLLVWVGRQGTMPPGVY